MNTPILSVVLPCYNEAENLPLILASYAEARRDFPFELILVNNGSTDNSADILDKELAKAEYSFAKTELVEKNQGYGHGIMTGLRVAKGEFLAFSHADMQCDAKDVFVAFDKLRSLPNPKKVVVKGKRSGREFSAKILTASMTLIASSILLTRLTDINAQPKVFHRSLMDNKLLTPPIGFEFDLYVLYQAKKAGMSIQTVPVHFGKRAYGQSKWAFSFFSRWKTIIKMIGFIFKLRFQSLSKHH